MAGLFITGSVLGETCSQTGTMPDMVTANPNGMGVGRSAVIQYWTGGGSSHLNPQQGYYAGINTWTNYNDPNLVPSNIVDSGGSAGKSGSNAVAKAGSPGGVSSFDGLVGGGGNGGALPTNSYYPKINGGVGGTGGTGGAGVSGRQDMTGNCYGELEA